VTRWLDGWPSALDSLVLLHRHNASILPLLVLPFQFQLIHALRADFAQLVFRVQEKIEEKRRHHDRGFPAYVEPVSERRPVLLSEEHTTGRNGKRL